MRKAKDNSGAEFGRFLAGALNMADVIPETVDLLRALSDAMASVRKDEDEGEPGGTPAATDPLALMVRTHALLLHVGVQYWLGWQDVATTHLPRIRRSLEQLKSQGKPAFRARAEAIDAIRGYLRQIALLHSEHGERLKRELEELDEDIFGAFREEKTPHRRHKYKA